MENKYLFIVLGLIVVGVITLVIALESDDWHCYSPDGVSCRCDKSPTGGNASCVIVDPETEDPVLITSDISVPPASTCRAMMKCDGTGWKLCTSLSECIAQQDEIICTGQSMYC